MAKRRRRAKGDGALFQRKDGRWQGEVFLGYDGEGRPRYKAVTAKMQAACREKLEQLKKQRDAGILQAELSGEALKITVAGYLSHWLEHKARQVKPRTVEIYRDAVARCIAPLIGRVPLGKLTALQVQTMVGELADQVGVRTANICRTVLYSALKQAIRWQLVMVNPVEAVDPLKETSREMTLWAPHEVVRFLEVAASHRLYALFYLVILTGLRRGEALGLCWQDVHGDNLMVRRSLTLVDGKPVLSPPKTAKGIRRVALSSDALSVLDEHRARQQALREFVGEAWGGSRWHDFDLVFTSELGTAIHPRNLERSWYVLQEKAGVPRVRLHDLRHLNVSLRRKQGQDAKLIADQVGHTNPAFTMRLYTHLFDDDRRGAALSMTDLLPARASSEPN